MSCLIDVPHALAPMWHSVRRCWDRNETLESRESQAPARITRHCWARSAITVARNPQPCSPIVPESGFLHTGRRALSGHGKHPPRANHGLRPQGLSAPGQMPWLRSPRTARPFADRHAMPCSRLGTRLGQPRRPDALQGLRAPGRRVRAGIAGLEFQGTPPFASALWMLPAFGDLSRAHRTTPDWTRPCDTCRNAAA